MKIKINFLDVQKFVHHFYKNQTQMDKFDKFFKEKIRYSTDDIYWYLEGELPGQVVEGIKLVDERGKTAAELVLEETWGE